VKVLSVKNPNAYLIVFGIKDVENRNFRVEEGRELLIHASGENIYIRSIQDIIDMLPDKIECEVEVEEKDDGIELSIVKGNRQLINKIVQLYNYAVDNGGMLEAKAIIAKITVGEISEKSDSVWASGEARFKWKIKKAELLEKPVRFVKGKLNLWEYDLNK
jgi:hypothetical protein